MFKIGQRLISETEPELGIGTLIDTQSKRITVYFQGVDEQRIYSSITAPLVRSELKAGDTVKNEVGTEFQVVSRREEDGLFYYVVRSKGGQEMEFPEWELIAARGMQRPQEKLLSGHSDSERLFDLRTISLGLRKKILMSPTRGMIGPRISLLPHQFYVTQTVTSQLHPRVLLADEVGLGKTIEAGLIIHKLLVTERIGRVLIVVPDALLYQWFLEMYRRFNLRFSIYEGDSQIEKGAFAEEQLWLTSFEQLNKHPNSKEEILDSEWDLLAVDEAHHLEWNSKKPSSEYEFVEKLSQSIKSVLLLTATPEQLGIEGHFARLHLLDPVQFKNFEDFKARQNELAGLAEITRDLLDSEKVSSKTLKDLEKMLGSKQLSSFGLSEKSERIRLSRVLVDVWGTGRIYIRNSRAHMEQDYHFFPKREAIAAELPKESTLEDKIDWVLNLVKSSPHEKRLLICKDKTTVCQIEEKLKNHRIKTTMFHEFMSLLERDRQAAYFSETDGAQIMICSEIGSEGRNFQFAHELIMFDLPESSDLLEQRIGRLDRIGQTSDIKIHIPYIKGTDQEVLFRFYHEGLNSFNSFSRGAALISAKFTSKLNAALENPKSFLDDKASGKFFKDLNSEILEIENNLEEGRNRLLEINSFNKDIGESLVASIEEDSNPEQLHAYMEEVFDRMGVNSDAISETADAIVPSEHLRVDAFPHLDKDGKTITFDRQTALEREDYHFLTWDHPMVADTLDLILGNDMGTACVSEWVGDSPSSPVIFEMNFILECQVRKSLAAEHFFPPTMVRVIIDQEKKNVTEDWPAYLITEETKRPHPKKMQSLTKVPAKFVDEIVDLGSEHAEKKASKVRSAYLKKMNETLDLEIHRLDSLLKLNSSYVPDAILAEIEELKARKAELASGFDESSLRLDSIRLVF